MRLSFRDPDGYVVRSGTRVFRCVFPHAAADTLSFLSTDFARLEMSSGAIAGAIRVPQGDSDACLDAPAGSLILEHSPIPFANFPYEWAPEMLYSAGALTLRLARSAAPEGFGLKDATPYNVMFDGPRPVFLDVLSFARRDPADPIWRPYAQFVRTFVYTLLANRHLGLQLDEILLGHREGLDPGRMRRMCSPLQLIRPPFLWIVPIPEVLSRVTPRKVGEGSYAPATAGSAEEAQFLVNRAVTRAERLLQNIRPPEQPEADSYAWGGQYSPEAAARKEEIVGASLDTLQPRNVLDIGCNTGRFSMLAAARGARVVAIDRDPSVVGRTWREASQQNAGILPLVIDIARPPGATGWANREHPSFLERARGSFDCVLMLALVHHLLVSERVPLAAIFELLAELTTRAALVEYIDPADAQFQRILRGRGELHRDFT